MSNSNEENISINIQKEHELAEGSSVNNVESEDLKNSSFVQSLKDGADKVTHQAIIKTRKLQEKFFYGNDKRAYRVVILVPEGTDFNKDLPENIVVLTSEYEAAKAGLPVIVYAPQHEYEGWALRSDSIEAVMLMVEALIALCIQSQQGNHDQNDNLPSGEANSLINRESETSPENLDRSYKPSISLKGFTQISKLISRK